MHYLGRIAIECSLPLVALDNILTLGLLVVTGAVLLVAQGCAEG